jgi:hypothetical protein
MSPPVRECAAPRGQCAGELLVVSARVRERVYRYAHSAHTQHAPQTLQVRETFHCASPTATPPMARPCEPPSAPHQRPPRPRTTPRPRDRLPPMKPPHVSSCAWRSILADLHEDQHAKQLIADEIGASPELWQQVANYATEIAGTLLISKTVSHSRPTTATPKNYPSPPNGSAAASAHGWTGSEFTQQPKEINHHD